jgi:hypothetical protein
MKTIIKENKEIQLTIEGEVHGQKQIITFVFKNGVMEKPLHNLNYKKDRADWEFYHKAIGIMLRKSKPFYKDIHQDEVPF